ncbi:hypothetical protein [Micromonospora parathelypteridis]|uniref:Uncharacterized protein n=1 Tax=Micromonospora parathelypteridis TaxID=1839617 RepID=A0A840VXU2_9ACTN|nr:hypothetical protein [Micromonospora parathelypteridis]MBB5478704.1 hypothetical protein [Micromonospora parathelypteridis]GGO04953.1 hypothetical protein GCM10011576_07050 [Micromonospora parathelypteridis]
MDALDRLAEPGLDLLRRVDRLIAAGVPEGHRVWPLLRRMQVLPGDAVRGFLDLHPAPLAGAGHAVRRLVRGYDDVSAALTDSVLWSGPAATAYGQQRTALLRHLDEGPESLVGRLESTAGYADALADWVEGSRLALARTLADVLRSAEAVAVVAATAAGASTRPGPVGPGVADAAEIGARVLAVLCVAYDGAETLLRQWAPSLAETAWRPPMDGRPRYDQPTRVGW